MRRGLVVGVLLAGAVVGGPKYLLPLAVLPLVDGSALSTADAIAISYGDRRYDVAANSITNEYAAEVLLFQDRDRWIVRVGALPPLHDIATQQLRMRNVPLTSITVLPGATRNRCDEIRRLAQWLDTHPRRSVVLLVERFQNRAARAMLQRALSPEAARRVSVCGLRDRRFDEGNWWRSRLGWREVFSGYLAWSYAVFAAEQPAPADEWDPDAYEAYLASMIQKSGGAIPSAGHGITRAVAP